MEATRLDALQDALVSVARETPGLDLLLAFGSRATGRAQPRSDWDFGFLGDPDLDQGALMARLVETVGNDRIDLVDLARAGGLVRYRAVRDGRLIHETRPGLHEEFRLEATRFWCDAEPVLRRGYEAVLEGIEP